MGIALWAATTVWFRRSKHGLALRSIGVDSEVASLMGINRRQLALVTMAVSGGMAGLAGVLFTYTLGAITPEEIAMSILAEITIERRRGQRAAHPVASR